MVHLQTMWHDFAAQQGNVPGAQLGDVVVTLIQPVDGIGEFTAPSDSVSVAAEAGNLIGLQAVVNGRRLFVTAGNIAGIIDAAPESERRSGRGRHKAPEPDGGESSEGESPEGESPEGKSPEGKRTPGK